MNLDSGSLSLEQKIGQMLMFGFTGYEPSGEFLELFKKNHLGNIVFFARNIKNAEHLKVLTQQFHFKTDIPPFLAIDQEGGTVIRIFEGASLLPGNMAVASTGEPELVRKYGEITGRELRALGININLAPVLDVNKPENPGIGVRSLGEDPETVSGFGVEMIKGMKSEGIFTTAKHFPGLGSADFDTHLEFPVINRSMEQLESVDLVPFKNAVDSGIDLVMTTHAGYPAFSKSSKVLPATFTKEILTGYLRDKMNFQGLIITDDLEMGAAMKSIGYADGLIKAVNAGADILCVCKDINLQKEAFSILKDAVDNNIIPESRIDESIKRIFRFKQKLISNRDNFFAENINNLVHEHAPAVKKIIRKSVQVYDPEGILPLQSDNDTEYLILYPKLREFSPVEEQQPLYGRIEKLIESELSSKINCEFLQYNLTPNEETTSEIKQKTENYNKIILFSFNAHLESGQKSLITDLSERTERFILFMLRNPYDRFVSNRITASVAVFAPLEGTVKAGIDRLF
ncbi:beta-N-acetylhexosaminidase [candidate division KSB1 bacterium]